MSDLSTAGASVVQVYSRRSHARGVSELAPSIRVSFSIVAMLLLEQASDDV